MPDASNDSSDSGAPAVGVRRRDLQERTAKFGESVILYARRLPVNPVTRCLIDQMVRAGTSVGANYCEADDAESRRDFRHKVSICLKEVKEVRHWLRMMAAAVPESRTDAASLWREARELNLILATIRRSVSGDR
jgi:four helix bundle protein